MAYTCNICKLTVHFTKNIQTYRLFNETGIIIELNICENCLEDKRIKPESK